MLSGAAALTVTIATGDPEGTYYQVARDIKELAEKEGILLQIVQTNGSFDNINLLATGKVDLAILQLDVLRLVAEIMHREAGINVLEEAKVVLNLYLEEIHVVSNDPDIRSLEHLHGKRVAVGPERSGSALTAEVLLAAFGLRVEPVFEAPGESLRKLGARELEAVIFVGGAPVPAFENVDASVHFVRVPSNTLLDQIYQRKKMAAAAYPWAGDFETYAVPSVIMTRERSDRDRIDALQKLVTAVLANKELLDSKGHPKWKNSFVWSTIENVGFQPTAEIIRTFNLLNDYGYRVIKK